MSFEAYRRQIANACAVALPDRLDGFCAAVVGRMLPYVSNPRQIEKEERAISIVESLVATVRGGAPDWGIVARALSDIDGVIEDLTGAGDYLAVDIVEFLDALSEWSEVHRNRAPSAAARVSEHMMNILDYHFAGASADALTWSSVPEIKAELDAQLAFLQ